MLKNELLRKAQEAILTGVQDRDVFDRLVKAGTKVIYDQKTFGHLSKMMRESKDPARDVGRGVVIVLTQMAQRARGTIPPVPLVQAGMNLVLDALDFLEQAGFLKVTPQVLDEATEEFVEALLPALGLDGQKLQGLMGKVKTVMADPQKMQQYRQQAGGAQ